MAYTVWTTTFAMDETLSFFKGDVADAIESDYFWISSIDRTRYDVDKNLLTYDASIDFESVYRNDLGEWRNDTWELYRDFSRDIWTTFMDGIGEPAGLTPDWARWTPRVRLNGNGGRLTVDCPGSLILAVAQRDATQDEFAKQCKFKN